MRSAVPSRIGGRWVGSRRASAIYLLTCLIEAVSRVANVAGTYAAYLKGWDSRAHKPLILHVPALVYSAHEHSVNHGRRE